MFRNIDQRNNLVSLLASVLLLLFKRKSIRTYLRRSVRLVSMMMGTYLLNGYNQRCHGYSGKQMGDADWLSGDFG